MIDILLVTFYKHICLEKTLESIQKNTKHPYRLWVIDNQSPKTEEIKNILIKYKDIISGAWLCDGNYIAAPYWWGFNNLVQKDSKYFIMTEGDIIIPDDKGCWITRAIEVLEAESKVGVVSIRTKPHAPDDTSVYTQWYNSWYPYKHYPDILVTDQIIWHNLVVRKQIIDNWVARENYNYFWYDGHFRNKMKESGYDCVGLDWDAYHYASRESLTLFPEYFNYVGGQIFHTQYTITHSNLTRII